MKNPTIAIIGAGIAGMAAGCYAQMNGFDSIIFEQHSIPGGVCTAWKRKGYTFDYCIHDLAGATPHSAANFIWRELGALDNCEIKFHDEFWQSQDTHGNILHGYTDVDRMIAQLRQIAPEDEAVIRDYEKGLRQFLHFELLALPAVGGLGILKVLPHLPAIMKWGSVTLDQFAQRFSNPFLRRAFPTLQYDIGGVPVMLNMNFLAATCNQQMGWPSGGSLAFAGSIAKRYKDLGGDLRLKSRVNQVIVKNNRAVGVELENEEKITADHVISAADGYSTIYRMLGGKFTNQAIDTYYGKKPDAQEMSLHINLGVNRDISEMPRAVTYLLDKDITIGDYHANKLDVEFFGFEKSFAPKGKGVVKVILKSGYDYWNSLKEDSNRYAETKEQAAGQAIAVLDNYLPGIKKQVEVIDVTTPVTVEKNTGSRFGYQAWASENTFKTMLSGLSISLPGLDHFYMTGQWAMATIGISTAAISSRTLIKHICKIEKQKFQSEKV